ncbi:MAG TPA: A24 family peptidase [Acidimicrobiales bacterium]|nr:A24 family peptidase [Acidimicrobiales bacterium]
MDTLLVVGTGIAGLLIGAALDPVGQRLAERSRLEDERRRAQRAADHQVADDGAGRRVPVVGSVEESARGATAPAGTGGAEGPGPADPTPDGAVRNLVPTGPSPVRAASGALLTGALLAAAADHFGRDLVLAPFCVFFALLVAVSLTDLSHRLVPRWLIYPALALIVPLLVLSAAVDHRWHSLTGSVVAGAVAFGLFFSIWWFVPRGMGFGDVRLAGTIGLTVGYLSLLHAYVAFLAGFITGMVFGLVLSVASSSGRKTRIPFAPSLSVGAVVAVFWGGHLAQSLFHAGT